MESTYLKQTLAKLAALREDAERIGSDENRNRIAVSLKGCISENPYPGMFGELTGRIWGASYDIAAARRHADSLEIIEREYERLIGIFEALDIDLSEETLATLELIGKRTYSEKPKDFRETSPYRDERGQIGALIGKLLADVQEAERESEHDQATDALLAAGFVHDEDGDCFTRGEEQVTVTLVNGRESRYEWSYESCDNGTMPGYRSDSGKSGEFSRLLALIAPASREVSQ